ncbi:MAG: hypothetical protein MJK18_12370 [Bdellovibrionales bacterium]|nr:hypothetical protein [Bdellovibrionales bacterium]
MDNSLYVNAPLDVAAIDSCATDDSIRNSITNSGDLYSAPDGFQQGDILVCQKALSSQTCADNEFQWINATNGVLSSTRPANPVQLTGTFAFQDNSCNSPGGDLVMGGTNFQVNLNPAIRVSKTRDAEDCLFSYNLQSNCITTGISAGSCTDTAVNGFGIDVAMDFNLTNSIFSLNTVDLDNDLEAAILQNLDEVLPKPLYIENNKVAQGTGDNTQIEATVSITIDNTIADNILVARGEDRNDYDENYCFIPQETGGP